MVKVTHKLGWDGAQSNTAEICKARTRLWVAHFHLDFFPMAKYGILYFRQMLWASWANPMSNSKMVLLLWSSNLRVIVFSLHFSVFQKYLNLSISNRQESGSTPQNSRTIDGEVDRGQFMSLFNIWVCRCSSSLAKPTGSAVEELWLYRPYVKVWALYSNTGLITSLYSLTAVCSLKPSSWKPCLLIMAAFILALSIIAVKCCRKSFVTYLDVKVIPRYL